MTIEQTVDIPADGRLHLDFDLPQTVCAGPAKVILVVPTEMARDTGLEAPQNLSPVLEKALEEAEQKRLYWKTHPEELQKKLGKLQEGGPLFGGIGADEFKSRCGDEWKERV
jgi:hypothetical protein